MNHPPTTDGPIVFVVDSDPAIAQGLRKAGRDFRITVEYCADTEAFLAACNSSQPGCLVSDLRLPGSNVEVFTELERQGLVLPVIVLSSSTAPATVVRAIRLGARDFLSRPCATKTLWEAVEEAVAWDSKNRTRRTFSLRARRRHERLTQGEAEVLQLLVRGFSNRTIAERLELSQRAIEVRRGNVMKKMRAKSLAELIRMALALDDS